MAGPMMDHAVVRRYYGLTVGVAVAVAVVQGLLILAVVRIYHESASQRAMTVGLATAGAITEELAASGRPWPESERVLRARLSPIADEDEIAIYDDGGLLLLRTTARLAEVPASLGAEARARIDSGEQLLAESGLLRTAAATGRDVGGRRYYVVRVSSIFDESLARLLPLALVALFLPMLLLGLSGAFLILRLTSRQLEKVDRVLRMMSSGDLSARLSLPVDQDTAGVVLSFNRMAEKVETTIEKLRRSDEIRRQLLADVTHELNTPLTSVLGYLETLTMEDLPLAEAKRRQLTGIAYEEAVNLKALIEDLTTLSRLDAEGLPIERVRVPLGPIVERVARRLSQMAEQRGVPLVTRLEPGVEVRGDPQRLDQVVRNLVENALRHTAPPGDVTVSLRRDGEAAILEVADRGAGMPPEALARIGQRFLRLDKSRARNTGGRGLGLAITVGLVEAHGGRAVFESELGSGTRVRVTLPLVRADDSQPLAEDEEARATLDSLPSLAEAGSAPGEGAGHLAAGAEGAPPTARPGAGTPATTPAGPAADAGAATRDRSPRRR